MNILAERSFPSFFKGYAPKLLKFYSDWLDWTEQPGNAQYILNHLASEQDIDESIEAYKSHLKIKLLPEFPERISTDLKLLLKNVLWLYRAKSSRKAYDFMFRVLFNSPAKIWHPRDLMLKTSDGRWDIPQYVGIAEKDGASVDWLIENCLGWRMTGLDSKAEAFVSAASSGYSGTIDCRASAMPSLARVAFYSNYDDINHRTLMPKLGTVECDPTLTAFRVTNPDPSSDEDLTAVWTLNKFERKTFFKAGQNIVEYEEEVNGENVVKQKAVIEIGTRSFSEPSITVNGSTADYEAINLEALVTDSNHYVNDNGAVVETTNAYWMPIKLIASDGMLTGSIVEGTHEGENAFVLAIEDTDEISFIQSLPIRRRGKGTSETFLADIYLNVDKAFHHGTLSKVISKNAKLSLKSSRFGECHCEAFSLLTKEYITAFGDERISIAELIDWSDTPLNLVYDTQISFEEPVSYCNPTLTYDFDLKSYVVLLDTPATKDVVATCEVSGAKGSILIPAGDTQGIVEISLPDPIVTVGSRNVFGVLLDTPTAHFAPGEKVRLLDPDTGDVSEIEPTVLWHAESDGHYSSTRGFLSDINAIQDNYYYQNYSYVVQSHVGIGQWRQLVKRLLHPAGLEIFGEMLIEGDLEDGNGIYYHDVWTFLKKSLMFFEAMVGMANQAIQYVQHILASSRLAQRHSITADTWLHWMQNTGSLRYEIKAIKEQIYSSDDPEERKELEAQLHELEALLSAPYMEDIRDWYDIRPSDVDELLNANSVLLFRNDGTLIDPTIVDWVDFSFTQDIDSEFVFRGESVSPHTTSIWGTTLHPLHPMIHGRIVGNEYDLQDGQEFIPNLYMAFVGSTQESSGVLVRTLVVGNEVLRYSEIARPDLHEEALVGETDIQKLARKYLFSTNQQEGFDSNGIGQWKGLLLGDFIYVNTDGGLAFNPQSLMKVPDAWTKAVQTPIVEEDPQTGEAEIVDVEQKYVFDRNAWNDEKISIVSYSPYDFSYRIWIERLNGKVQCSITAYGVNQPNGLACPLLNSNLEVVQRLKETQYINGENGVVVKEIYCDDIETSSVCVWHEPSGWNGPSKDVYATTTTWNMAFKDPKRVSSWFDIDLKNILDDSQILCFVNGLMQPKPRIKGTTLSVDTILDNSSISYSSNRWNFADLSLEEYVLDDDGNYVLDKDGNPTTALVMVSVNESDNVAFQELDLNDLMVINEEIESVELGEMTLQGIVYDIIGCSISSTLSYAEIYVLAPIEGSRKLQYPWHGWSMENENGQEIWPFTYDNARLFPYSAHNEAITSIKDAEINPDKEAIRPSTHWVVQYHNVSRLLNGFQREIRISETIVSQKQSETVDRILATWWNDASRRMQADFLKNEHWLASANFSSTLVFGSDGLLVDPRTFDWSTVSGDGGHGVGLPEKFWSRPLGAELPVEFAEIIDGAIASDKASFKEEGSLVFVDGLKILDTEVEIGDLEYHFNEELEGKEAAIFSMGRDWVQRSGGLTGYFNAVKTDDGWTLTTKRDGEYVQTDTVETLDNIDLVEFIGLSLGRSAGAIWPEDDSVDEIKGSTELFFNNGDKRRFIDLRFLDYVDIMAYNGSLGQADTKRTTRLYGVNNYRTFGIVERIVDLDPRFFMVFIDGHHSPMEAHEWRYLKGTLFIDADPEASVEVYIGNPYSYLAPDFAKCAPEGFGELVFNNLRINPVPRHMTTTTLWRSMEVGHMHFGKHSIVEWHLISSMVEMEAMAIHWRMDIQTAFIEQLSVLTTKELRHSLAVHFNSIQGMKFKIEVRWKDVSLFWNLGFMHENRIECKTKVVNLSETFDDVAFWGQMDPSAWSGIGFNALSKTGKSSIMSFNSDGDLIDPFDVNHHEHLLMPWSVGNVVEILTPEDIVHMARVYWPIYEVDSEAHRRPYPEDSRFYELMETSFRTVVVDGLTFDIEQHFAKEVQDLHLEEDAYIFPRPDMEFSLGRYSTLMEDAGWDGKSVVTIDDEHLFLTDSVADKIETADGWITGIAMDAEHPMLRNVQIILEGGAFIVPVPRIGGELVFVDGVKLTEGTFERQAIVNGNVVLATTGPLDGQNVPSGSNVNYAIEILDPDWKDNDEHVVVIYWPNESWAERHSSPEVLKDAVAESLEPDWKDMHGFETYNEYVQSRFALFCNGILVRCLANEMGEIFFNGIPFEEYECSSYELYVVDLSNRNCRTCETSLNESDQAFNFDNQQRNWFMESHVGETFWHMAGLPMPSASANASRETSIQATMPEFGASSSTDSTDTSFVANNRDTFDNVFVNGSVPVRQYINPSLYVERISKIEVIGLDDLDWKVVGEGEDAEEVEFAAIDAVMLDESYEPTGEDDQTLVSLEKLENVIDGKLLFKTDYIPQSWNFQLYATARENPTFFYPSERMDSSKWMYYQGWNQRLELIGLESGKDIYILETLDVSMPDSIANTDQVYWLEKEFNKKSTLMLDHDGLLEHPDGLEWCNGIHIFPHRDKWTAQAEEAEFPAVVNELVPDNVQKRQVMELCLDDLVGYDGGISLVGDACNDSLVAINERVYRTSPWELLANEDYIYWEEGPFENWIAWLRDDDVFDRSHCFVFVNGLKIPDWIWTYDAEKNTIAIPFKESQMIERLGFIHKGDIYDEVIYEDNIQATLIDPNWKVVNEAEYNRPVIVDSNWVIWKDANGFPVWGDQGEVKDDQEVVVIRSDGREGIIWPISRIWKYFNSCTSEGIDVPEYYGYDLSKYVLAWVDGRHVQCTFEGTRIFVPGCDSAETVEVYVFELHDGAWVERFNAIPEPFTLTSFRDLRVC